MRVLVYAETAEELAELTSRLDADGHAATGTVEGELAVDLASASDFEALVIDRRTPRADQLRLAADVARRSPQTLVIRANGPEALLTQMRQALAESGAAAGRGARAEAPGGTG